MSRRARFFLASCVVLAVALAIFGRPLFRGEVLTFRDHSDYFQPLRLYTLQELRAGRLPLWNPYNASGEPWAANPQTGVFYPPSWIFLVLPFATAYVGYLFLHALILGAGAFLLFSRRASAGAALTGTAALMVSGPVLSLLDISNNYTTFAWVPMILWRGAEDRESGGWRLSALLLAMAFLGAEPFLAAVAAVLYVIMVRRWRQIAAAGITSAGLVSIQLLPFLEMVRGSNRVGGFVREDVLRGSMPLGDWLSFVEPPRFAHPSQSFIFVAYVGLLTATLAIAGLVALTARKEWKTLAGWCGLLVVTALVATGPEVVAALPVTLFRYPARVLPFAALATAALAVAGWERLRRGSPLVDAVLIAAIVVDLMVAARPLLASAPFGSQKVPYEASVGRDRKVLQAYTALNLAGGSRYAWISGYLNLPERRFAALTASPLTSQRYSRLYEASLQRVDLVREMAVGWVLSTQRLPVEFVPVKRVQRVIEYQVTGALPMAYVRIPEGRIVGVEDLRLEGSHVSVRVNTSSGGMLILTQNEAPGWSARVDGRAVPGHLALGTFRSVNVPPGMHEVVWSYRPGSLMLGAGLTLATILALVVSAARVWGLRDDLSSVTRTKIASHSG